MLPSLFQKAVPILKKIEEHGFEAYFVGGCVRDMLLHRNISDVDIATSATPIEIKQIFNRTIDVGIEHGTVIVLYGQNTYEVTTFRTESTYQDFRRPDKVEFIRSLEEDLKRRDFTINALAMDRHGKIYDFHNGVEHLEKKVIQAVGDANERFFEDALRMMRAIRFSGQLGFSISNDTEKGILVNRKLLENIAVERIVIELEKLFSATYRNQGLNSLLRTKLFEYLPFIQAHHIQFFLNHNKIYHQSNMNYALLLYSASTPAIDSKKILKSFKLSNQLLKEVEMLLRILEYRKSFEWTNNFLFDIPEYLAKLGETLAKDLNIIHKLSDVSILYENLPIKSIQELALNGKDIIQLLHQEHGGAYLGEIIEDLRLKVLNNVLVNDKNELIEYVVSTYGARYGN